MLSWSVLERLILWRPEEEGVLSKSLHGPRHDVLKEGSVWKWTSWTLSREVFASQWIASTHHCGDEELREDPGGRMW
jgi:hypothetical protein